jgi:TPR repeat protein/serine/threonine protein kinase
MKRKPGTVYNTPSNAPRPARASELAPGDVIAGHYVVEDMLGDGGMAVVYRATNSATGKQVALKVLQGQLGERPEFVQMFAKEAKVSAVIGDNDHIVQVFDAGLDEDRHIPFIVMELLEGETLEQALERGPLDADLIRLVLDHLAIALEQAHQAGVVHRDLKPSNLFITSGRDGRPLLKVMDFGIAKVLEGEAVRTATQLGTPAYNAPEQMGSTTRKLAAKQGITIAAGVSPATDVWAIGLLAYEMFTGDLPGQYWGVETLSELPMKVAFEEQSPASARAGRNAGLLPPGFDGWFLKCLRKNAAERYATAGEAIDALLALIDEERELLEVREEELDAAATRVVYEAPQRISQRPSQPGRRSASSPPPLPRVSSPAIAVAKPSATIDDEPSNDGEKIGASTARPVVRGSTKDRASRGDGKSRQWGVMMGVATIALATAGVVGYGMNQDAAGSKGCLDGGSADNCARGCDAGSLESCHRLAKLVAAGDGVQKDDARARALLEKACGVDALGADASAEQRRAWQLETEKEGCAAGTCVSAACATLATAYELGQGGPKNELAASALFKRVCSVGFDDARGVDGCVGLGKQRERAGEAVAARNYYNAACDGDLSSGCVALAAVLERGDVRGEGRDEKRARALYQKACDAGDLEGCTRLGSMVERGRGGWVMDEKAAVGYYQRACEGGQLLGCVHLASAYRAGKGGLTRDAVRAAELLQSSCDGGEERACAEVARMVLAGEGGLPRDEKRAFAVNHQACEAGALQGCSQLGDMYLAGMAGLTPDPKEARVRFDQACRGGEPRGCVSAAKLEAAEGNLLGRELEAVYDKGCEDGDLAGCVALAEVLEKGSHGLDQDLERAAGLYGRGCDGGNMRGCTQLANLTYQGAGGLERSAKRSMELNERACEGGDPVGCARLGLLHALGQGTPKDLGKASELHRKACKAPGDEENKQRCDMLRDIIAGKVPGQPDEEGATQEASTEEP